MELEHYLQEQFPKQTDKDFECKICNELVMKVCQAFPCVQLLILNRSLSRASNARQTTARCVCTTTVLSRMRRVTELGPSVLSAKSACIHLALACVPDSHAAA